MSLTAVAPSIEADASVSVTLEDIVNGTLHVVRPVRAGIDLIAWAGAQRERIDALLHQHGALLLRGFDTATERFADFIATTSDGWATYREPATPRTQVASNIYTSTEYPEEHEIPLHNENSHCTAWPLKIYFNCMTQPQTDGQTPIADCRRVLERLPPALVQRFVERKWLYVRNFGYGLGFSWQKVFDTDSRAGVETYCRDNGMNAQWHGDGTLRVTYLRDAVRIHPVTGERIWFNHGLFFNPVSINPGLRELLLESFSEDQLPYNTYYGDGSAIEPDVLDTLRAAYASETRWFDWRPGDILMLDNMLVAHGRKPFSGARRIVVGMADSYSA